MTLSKSCEFSNSSFLHLFIHLFSKYSLSTYNVEDHSCTLVNETLVCFQDYRLEGKAKTCNMGRLLLWEGCYGKTDKGYLSLTWWDTKDPQERRHSKLTLKSEQLVVGQVKIQKRGGGWGVPHKGTSPVRHVDKKGGGRLMMKRRLLCLGNNTEWLWGWREDEGAGRRLILEGLWAGSRGLKFTLRTRGPLTQFSWKVESRFKGSKTGGRRPAGGCFSPPRETWGLLELNGENGKATRVFLEWSWYGMLSD